MNMYRKILGISLNKGFLAKILLLTTVVALTIGWFLADATSNALAPPVIHQDLHHFRRSRSLDDYLKNIQVLIEPSTTACDQTPRMPLLALVTSSPPRFDQREAIRNTWAKHVPTYFIMGLNGLNVEDLQTDNYIEAKMYSDVVVYDFSDHYQNLTLKTALMLKWTLARCPHAQFVFKTDDDVLVNPWTMRKVLALHEDADLIGYRKVDTFLHRDEHNKWYLPRWLYYEDRISEYLSGTGYLIKGKNIKSLFEAAFHVSMINLEDVYLTYLVAKIKLGSLLTEPSSTPCEGLGEVPLVVLVTSAPSRFEHRDGIRATWAPHLPTYFVLGLTGKEEEMENIYLEAKQYNDLIVYDFEDHYQNLTVKTGLMLRWTRDRCPQAGFMLKTDDDVLVNPWKLKNVVKENPDAMLIGYKFENIPPIRDEYAKWYLPSWLYEQDSVPEYLSGTSYLFNVKYIKKILDAATDVPMINLEDMYFSYLVAYAKLGLKLTHDDRMYPYMPFLTIPCRYWSLAAAHDLTPQDMVTVWRRVVKIAHKDTSSDVCSSHLNYYLSFFVDVS